MSFPPTQFGAPSSLELETCQNSKYLVYCDSTLPTFELFQHWYQYLSLSLAAAAILIPTIIFPTIRWIIRSLGRLRQRWKSSKHTGMATLPEKPDTEGSGWDGVSLSDLDPDNTMNSTTSVKPGIRISAGSSVESLNDISSAMSIRSDRVPSAMSFRSDRGPSAMSSRISERVPSALSLGYGKPRLGRVQSTFSVKELCDDERRASYMTSGLPSSGLPNPGLSNMGSARSSMESDHFTFPSFLRSDPRMSMESINMMPEADSEIAFNPLQNFDLRITPLFTRKGGRESRFSTASRSASPSGHGARKTVVGLVDLEDLGPDAFHKDLLLDTVDELNMLRIGKCCAGLVLKVHDDIYPKETVQLLNTMVEQRIGVMLMCDTDAAILRSVDFGSLIGVILENATILPDGQRRDFFRSDRMRGVMDRCALERVERPTFFLGFNDLWETRPTAAVVRRAFKLAEFFGATLTHGPAHTALEKTHSKFPISMSGFDYLKGYEIVDLQKSWINETRKLDVNSTADSPTVAHLSTIDLIHIFPSIDSHLELLDLPEELKKTQQEITTMMPPPVTLTRAPGRRDFWSLSSDGEQLSQLGCFPLNRAISKTQYDAVLESQQHLESLQMLHCLDDVEILKLTDRLRTILETTKYRSLVDLLLLGLTFSDIQVYKGLDSGFGVPGDHAHLWGMSAGSTSARMDIFVSQKAPSLAATVLHVYLAHHGVPREQRYEEELGLEHALRPDVKSELPVSIQTELADSTNSELLFLLEQIKVSNLVHPFARKIREICVERLINEASREAWIETHSKCFLEGSISMRKLLQLRLEDFARRGASKLPSLNSLEQLYQSVDALVADSLFWAERDKLEQISKALIDVYKPWEDPTTKSVDLRVDLFALMFFCALRKNAFENVFLETTDRCPFFLTQPDQAGVFSELWVLGSQCDIYFGILPRALGKIIYDKYRDTLRINPPPANAFNCVNVLTAYSFAHDAKHESPTAKADERLSLMTRLQQKWGEYSETAMEFGALAIFCMPAIVDVCLLTWLGRGFFLTAFMNAEDVTMASFALLASLLISAGNTGWVGSVGGHYLYNFAFDNMNFFLVQRLSSGFVVSILVSICGFIAFALKFSPRIASVFVAYVVVLCTYLNLLGILATMHRKGAPLTSGRTVLWRTIPFLFISPIVSTFVRNHDLPIYLSVLYAFLLLLLFQYRNLCHEWANWISRVPVIKTDEVTAWYKEMVLTGPSGEKSELTGDALDKAATTAFQEAVNTISRVGRKPEDSLVSKAAAGLPFALWLLEKESPSPDKNAKKKAKDDSDLFTKIWLAKVEQALKSTQQLAQGLKEHSVFVLFRYGEYDMAQSFGLFLIALMDHWVAVAMSARRATLAPYTQERSRYGNGLCVLFFLMSAIAVDATLQPYWEANSKPSNEKLVDAEHAKLVARQAIQQRRRRWFDAFFDLFTKIACVFGVTTGLVWILVRDPGQLIMYYAFIVGYTGVLTFQFNRCFTTNARAHVMSVFVAAIIGFSTGCLLHAIPATSSFVYTNVLALVVASTSATVFTTIWVFIDPELEPLSEPETDFDKGAHSFSSQDRIGNEESNTVFGSRLAAIASFGPGVNCSDGSPLARSITELLALVTAGQPASSFPEASWSSRVLQTAFKMWREGTITITLSNRQVFERTGLENSWSFGEYRDGILSVVAGFLDDTELELYQNNLHDRLALLLAEAVLYHTTTTVLSLSPRHALKVECLLQKISPLAGRIEVQLATEDEASLMRLLRRVNAELMKPLCFDLDVNTQWHKTPVAVREAVLARVVGHPTPLSPTVNQWMELASKDIELEDFHVSLSLRVYDLVKQRLKTLATRSETSRSSYSGIKKAPAELQCRQLPSTSPGSWIFTRILMSVVSSFVTFSKWLAILSGAASEVERELWYSLQRVPLSNGILTLLLIFWRVCWYVKNGWITIILIYRRPALKRIIRLALRGSTRELVRNSIVAELPEKTVTGFAWQNLLDNITLSIYDGSLETQPPSAQEPIATAVYDGFRLRTRIDQIGAEKIQSTYHYPTDNSYTRVPSHKDVVESNRTLRHQYDKSGRIISGHLSLGSTDIEFAYHYRRAPKHNCDILSAVYRQSQAIVPHTMTVFWSVVGEDGFDQDDMAVPSERVTRVVKEIGDKIYVTTFTYQHKCDPRSSTEEVGENGKRTAIGDAPRLFEKEDELLKKPANLSFDSDDLLFHHRPGHLKRMLSGVSPNQGSVAKFVSKVASFMPFGLSYWSRHVVFSKITTWRLRAELWTIWLKTNNLDAVTACWIDELILRQEPLLQAYWRMRNCGRLRQAKEALDKDIEEIVSAIEMPFEVSQTCVLPIKPADLYVMGLGKDATQITNRPEDCYKDTKDRISVIFNDVGCWPDAPGGVSNCRRDLVNGHKTIRNHVLAESAHDYGISRFQLEKNVQSLKALPLWGLDFKTAQHGIIDNLLQSQVDEKIEDTYSKEDVVGIFIPTLRTFVKGSRTKHASREQLLEFSNAMLTMSSYFERKDYNKTWRSKEVEMAWVEAWLYSYNDPNILDPSELFELERPSMEDFQASLALYMSYFMIYGVQVPEECPRVFQSTHHGISSLFGMVLKYRKGTTFALWDHAILWRECCLNISPAQCLLPISVQAMLLSGIGLAARLAYLHVDVLLPCTSVFNPVWEAEIGTDSGRTGSKKLFNRKIDPIANGISNMTAFEPTKEPLKELPTVVMLSNIQTIKDVKAAVLAADHIINDFGFEDYRLHIYGAQDREPAYTMATLQIIADRNLTGKVVLAGFGNPKKVLKDAWLFVNSSLSEGLPLAIGEAALTGVPIVATEVGGTSLVLTDPDDNSTKYGEVVPPNDPMALARAQINVLAMMGQWASYTDDKDNPPILPNDFTPEDVKRITQRMHDKSEDRRKLGLKCREVVLRSFHGNRYLREHEQMYWIQWHMARMLADETLDAEAHSNIRFGITPSIRCDIDSDYEEEISEYGQSTKIVTLKYRWQDFTKKTKRQRNHEKNGGEANEHSRLAKRNEARNIARRQNSLEVLRTGDQKRESAVSKISKKSKHPDNAWDMWNV